MIKAIYQNILDQQDIRKNLIELKKQIKEKPAKNALIRELAGNYEVFYRLLEDEDAKVRKNVALIMGELAIPEFSSKLYEAYEKEEKLFVKSDYLVALKAFDYRELLEPLKKRLDFITTTEVEEGSRKHIDEEIRVLNEMVLMLEGTDMHPFTGYNELSDLILLTNRDHQEITLDQIKKGKGKVFNAGVVVRTKELKEILDIRTYSDLLFRLNGISTVESTPLEAAKAIYEGGLLDFLDARHEGGGAYYFRLEIKSKMPLDKKSTFAKKMASELERVSGRKLINSTSNYEFEIRLIENKEGEFNVLLKLYTLPDTRFEYRKNAIAASIQPVGAALIAELAKDYLKQDAVVLDPFCGVGTMLLERDKVMPAQVMYGVDIFGEAIEKATENADLDNTDVYFINRDFFDFGHKYLFDEIFTNMPARSGRKSEQEMTELYNKFFEKAAMIMKNQGIIVMYTRDRALVQRNLDHSPQYTLLKEFEISRKEAAYVCILQVKKN
ncbi:MAG: TRM11 family SAM-dependent methyltransferase [Cellulosilyticaceae bacterium]